MIEVALGRIAAFGVFVAVPVVGYEMLRITGVLERLQPVSWLGRLALVLACGLMVWTVPLLGSAMMSAYQPALLGVIGWIIALILLTRGGDWARLQFVPLRGWHAADITAGLGLAAAALIYIAFPADTSSTGRDMSVYSNHAVWLARHGTLDVLYPWPASAAYFAEAFTGFPGLYRTQPTMTVQFAHVFPVWLSQTFASAGFEGMYRANAPLMLLGLATIHGVLRCFVNRWLAAVAVLLLAFNPATLWMARTSLTEPMMQWFIWGGILLFLANRTPASRAQAVFAGMLLGFAFFVRIDSLLLLPFILAGHAAMRSVHGGDVAVPWKFFYVAFLTVMTAAMLYYFFYSRPYLDPLSAQVGRILMMAIACALFLLLTFYEPVRARISSRVRTRVFAGSVIAAVLLTAAYMTWVRPIREPFDLFNWPGTHLHNTRSYVEDGFINLAAYVSPIGLVAALAGAAWVIWRALTGRWRPLALPMFFVILGYTALYSWNQSISPDHLWAIRRFVPVVLPGIMILALIAVDAWLGAFRFRTPVLGVLALAAFAYTWHISSPIALVAEDRGAFRQVAAAAELVPPGEPILGFGFATWMSPLYLAFDRHVIPIDPSSDEGRFAAFQWMASQTAEGRPVFVYGYNELDLVGTQSTLLAHLSIPLMRIERTVDPVPRGTFTENMELYAYRVERVGHLDVPLGNRPAWAVAESGFYGPEVHGDALVRWTAGSARLDIPLNGSERPRAVEINIADTGPNGTRLEVIVNGGSVFDDDLPAGQWSGSVPVELNESRTELVIELVTDTFVPNHLDSRNEDDRELGVLLSSIIVRGEG